MGQEEGKGWPWRNGVTEQSSCAWCTVRPNKPKVQSLEQRMVYCRAKQGDGWLMLKNPEPSDGFGGEVFNRQNLG